ncbi:unnamed protein product [Heligmosomoides polygyrus]|uniref:Uncharacterized protein n=1 Tax=Heligmosomoides polygyrus TaxID=6339 RepID=A0A183G3R6_HELPZ|nr:unnamed protein product [Heligmosomoides polygyrus]
MPLETATSIHPRLRRCRPSSSLSSSTAAELDLTKLLLLLLIVISTHLNAILASLGPACVVLTTRLAMMEEL